VTFTADRASANNSALRYLFAEMDKDTAPRSILPFVQFCEAHGVALVKSKARQGHDLIRIAHSFTCLTKGFRFVSELRAAFIFLVKLHLQVKREQRPEQSRVTSARLVELLFGDETALTRGGAEVEGKRKPRRVLLDDLAALTTAFDLTSSSDGLSGLTHYCWVEEGSEAHRQGHEIGTACCSSRQESIERTVVPFLNVMVGAGWDNSSLNKWTYVSHTVRRLCLGVACHRLLEEGLRHVQVFWRASENFERELLRLVQADAGDFGSRQRLRLLRICKFMCGKAPGCGWQLALIAMTLSVPDKILFAILGTASGAGRACWTSSPSIARSSQKQARNFCSS